jgi:hypothetical protein
MCLCIFLSSHFYSLVSSSGINLDLKMMCRSIISNFTCIADARFRKDRVTFWKPCGRLSFWVLCAITQNSLFNSWWKIALQWCMAIIIARKWDEYKVFIKAAQCYLTKFWDSCRQHSFAYAAEWEMPWPPCVRLNGWAALFGMQFFASLAWKKYYLHLHHLYRQGLQSLGKIQSLRIRGTEPKQSDNFCQWLAAGQWFSPDPPFSSTNKSDRHDITEILLKVIDSK